MQKNKLIKVWIYLTKSGKVIKDTIIECAFNDILDNCLDSACKAFDLSRPVVLAKHHKELDKFMRTYFQPGDFLEHFAYKSLTLEILRTKQDSANSDWRTQI